MANLTYSQLEQLWIQAGGSPTLAPYAAATAIVESGGDPGAYNASGATGLWQIEYPGSDVLGYSSAQLDNPLDNAKAAVALSKNTMAGLLSNWTAYEPAGAAAAIVKQNGGTVPSSTSSTASSTAGTGTVQGVQGNVPGVSAPGATPSGGIIPGGTTTTAATPSSTGLPSILAGASGLLYDVSTALDYFFGMFGRGQGWRLVFAVICIVALLLALKTLAGAGAIPSGLIPSAIPVPV
jgi:hypothetical protein